MAQNTKTGSRIREFGKSWTREADLQTPIGYEKVGFAFPPFGLGDYHSIVRQVLDAGQKLPTGRQIAFMLDDVYNSEDIKGNPRAESARGLVNNAGLWVPQVAIITPRSVKNPGMYSVFDEDGQGLTRVYTIEELEDRLSGGDTERRVPVRFSQDRSVAFAPQKTISAGEHKKGTLSQDGAYIATYDVDGAEKLDAVDGNFTLKPYSWVLNNGTDSNIQRVSALSGSGDLKDDELYAVFGSLGGSRVGYVVSVSGSENIKNSG